MPACNNERNKHTRNVQHTAMSIYAGWKQHCNYINSCMYKWNRTIMTLGYSLSLDLLLPLTVICHPNTNIQIRNTNTRTMGKKYEHRECESDGFFCFQSTSMEWMKLHSNVNNNGDVKKGVCSVNKGQVCVYVLRNSGYIWSIFDVSLLFIH